MKGCMQGRIDILRLQVFYFNWSCSLPLCHIIKSKLQFTLLYKNIVYLILESYKSYKERQSDINIVNSIASSFFALRRKGVFYEKIYWSLFNACNFCKLQFRD